MNKCRTDRRRALAMAAGLAATFGLQPVRAQSAWPSQPIRIVVPFPPGGVMDIAARAIGNVMAREMRQPVVVENRPGAAGNLGTEAVARAAADGHTLLYGIGSTFTVNPHLYGKLGFDPLQGLVPITETVTGGMALLVRPEAPPRSLSQWLDWVKARPGRLTYASYGNGSFPHLNMELLKSLTGTHIVHIPYRGAAPAMQDFLGGQVDMMFDQTATAIPQIRAGRAVALAVNTPKRLAALPDVPAIAETIAGFDGSGWQGMWAPAGTPAPVVQQLHRAVIAALEDPDVRKRFTDSGLEIVGSTPEQVQAKMIAESRKWGEVVRSANVKID